MNSENKNCQNCHQNFTIEPEDFKFYEKISVPPPTWCPECRTARRAILRNERTLYRNKCTLCNKDIITLYSKDKPYKVYCHDCYRSDKWEPLNYGLDIDFSKSFLEQFKELQLSVPRLYAFVFNNVNSEYTNGSAFNKKCYLLFVSDHNEDSAYSYSIFNCKDTFDSLNSNECELCYESVTCKKCYKVFFSQDCVNSQNLYFCKNCSNCQDCIGSVNLRNKQYYIFNEPHTKEDYFKKLQELGLDSFKNIAAMKEKAHEFWPKFLVKYIHGQHNVDVVGDYIFNSKKTSYSYDSEYLEDSKYINHANKAKDCYDGYVVVDDSQLSYEIVSAIALHNVKFGYCVWHDFDTQYSDTCENSSNLFACIGLRNKSYCILNKQYTKEEYLELVPRIMKHMDDMPYIDKKGRVYKYGEFFPPELSPFSYNETIAQEYFPLTKEQALEQGYSWKDPEPRNYQITLKNEDIPDHIKDVKDDILDQIIECAHAQGSPSTSSGQTAGAVCNEQCTEAYRIIPQELEFLRKMNLPLPRLCPNCRHYQRIKQRNPLKLWHRKCMCGTQKIYQNTIKHDHEGLCPNEFETTYAPERPEIVYCEKCYLKEVV